MIWCILHKLLSIYKVLDNAYAQSTADEQASGVGMYLMLRLYLIQSNDNGKESLDSFIVTSHVVSAF
jgi:hypothetical protein